MARQIAFYTREMDRLTNFDRKDAIKEYTKDFIKQYYFNKVKGEKDEESKLS